MRRAVRELNALDDHALSDIVFPVPRFRQPFSAVNTGMTPAAI